NAAHHTSLRHRQVPLTKIEGVTHGILKPVKAVPLEKKAPIIRMLHRGHLKCSRHGKFTNLHAAILSRKNLAYPAAIRRIPGYSASAGCTRSRSTSYRARP